MPICRRGTIQPQNGNKTLSLVPAPIPRKAYTSQMMRYNVARDGYRTDEYGSDSDVYVAEKNIEKELLRQIQEAIKKCKHEEAQKLQKQLDIFRESQACGSRGQIGNRRHILRLYVVNKSEDYVIRFSSPPFQTVGELGPGEMSDYPVEILEGSCQLQYMEKRLNRNESRWMARSFEIFIEKGRSRPIEIHQK